MATIRHRAVYLRILPFRRLRGHLDLGGRYFYAHYRLMKHRPNRRKTDYGSRALIGPYSPLHIAYVDGLRFFSVREHPWPSGVSMSGRRVRNPEVQTMYFPEIFGF